MNMKLKLVKASHQYKEEIIEMLEEWTKFNIENPKENKSPSTIFRNDYHDFDNYIKNLDIVKAVEGKVPSSTFFLYDEERNMMLGVVSIRHYLNDYLLQYGGHVGDGIRPSERRKGLGTKMVKLALEECKKIGIEKVLMTCNKENVPSAKTIIKNGGILENEVSNDGEIMQRYWINLKG